MDLDPISREIWGEGLTTQNDHIDTSDLQAVIDAIIAAVYVVASWAAGVMP